MGTLKTITAIAIAHTKSLNWFMRSASAVSSWKIPTHNQEHRQVGISTHVPEACTL
jgi:hypothetical protein